MATNHGYSIGAGWKGLLADLGVRYQDVLRRADLPEDLLNHRDPRVSGKKFLAFARAIEEEIDHPQLPVVLIDAMTAEFFSPPVFASLCSPNLEVAAKRLARFKPLVAPVRLSVETVDDGLKLSYLWHDTLTDVPASMYGAEALFIVKLARMGTREHVRPTSVTLPMFPPRHEAYEEYIGTSFEPGAGVSVTFSREDAARPFLSANNSMWEIFEPELRQRLADLEGAASFEERTRAVLLEALPSGQGSLEIVARRLATSPRSLQRRLRHEGTSFKSIVRETRERLARHYLSNTAHSSSEIAYLLGFEDPTSFFRAFHSWTGSTPERLRRAAAAPA